MKQVGARGSPLCLPSTETIKMLPRTPRLCQTRDLPAPSPLHPCLHYLLASSYPSKTEPGRGPSLASGRLPPELLSHAQGEPPPCHSHSSACLVGTPGPWLTRPQCPLCAWSCQIWACRGPSPCDGKTTGRVPGWTSRAGPCGTRLRAAACREAGRPPGQVGLAARSLSHVLSQPGLLI